MEKNLYIETLKFALPTMQTGITFKQVHNYLSNQLGIKFDKIFLEYFRYWFYRNFYHRDVTTILNQGIELETRKLISGLHIYDDLICVMTSNAYSTLLDYEKLQQAKFETKKASRLALWAIYISGGLALIQIILQVCSMAAGKQG